MCPTGLEHLICVRGRLSRSPVRCNDEMATTLSAWVSPSVTVARAFHCPPARGL